MPRLVCESMAETGEGPEGPRKKWAGYADYESVASQLHEDINRAVEAYAHLNSRDVHGIAITPQTAVNTRTAILKITKRLEKEVARNRDVDPFDEIHERWSDELDDGGEVSEAGYVTRLENTDFYEDGAPSWLGRLVEDIVEAGWELGYTKAGVEKPAEPEADEQQVKEMFE